MALNSYLLPKERDPWVSNKNKTALKFYKKKKKYNCGPSVSAQGVLEWGPHSDVLLTVFNLLPPSLQTFVQAVCEQRVSFTTLPHRPHSCRLPTPMPLIHCCLCLIKAHSDNLPTKLLLFFYRILGERDEVQIRSETHNSVSSFSVKWEHYESRVSTYHLFLTPIR